MRKSNWSEAQIVSMLREHESGLKVAEICREYGVSQPTFYQSAHEVAKYTGAACGATSGYRGQEA